MKLSYFHKKEAIVKKIKKQSYPRNRAWKPIGVFPVRYEHHLHIISKVIP
jgi:hypothetical protein